MNTKNDQLIRRKPEQDRSRKRIDDVMEAVKTLITERGLDPIKMTDIAVKAGMKVTALYRYFPNKQAVLRELTLRMFEQDRSKFVMPVIASKQPITGDLIKELNRVYWQLHVEEPYRVALYTAIQADPMLSELYLNDAKLTSRIIAERELEEEGVREPQEDIERRIMLNLFLTNSAVQLASKLSASDAEKVIEEFSTMSVASLIKDIND